MADIFGKKYEELTANHDLYEACVLGSILTKGKVATADYQILAKEYYENVKATKVESNVEATKPNIEGTYNTTSSEMKTETVTKIENKTTIES